MPRLPKPFKRPSINLDGDVKKEWREELISKLHTGDIVQDKGMISELEVGPLGCSVTYLSGQKFICANTLKVRAFTAVIE